MEIQIKEIWGAMTSPQDIAVILQSILAIEDEADRDKEHFWVIGLSSCKRIRMIELITLGLVDQALIHPREVFRPVIVKSASSIIIAHNHPAGLLSPSAEDRNVTLSMISAGKVLGISVIDHIIITDKAFYSFKEQGIM